MPKDKLNIVIPLYNPHPGWEEHFAEILSTLENKFIETDLTIILVNDGSTKEISMLDEILKRFAFVKYYSYPVNMGKGYAVRYGVRKEDADYYFYTDADLPFGVDVIFQAYRELKSSEANLIIGIRDISYFRALPVERKIISYLLKGFSLMVTGFKLKDTQAPLKGMDNKARQVLINSKINGFIFDFEFLLNCLKHDISFISISMTPRKEIVFTDFSFKTIIKEIKNLLKVIF